MSEFVAVTVPENRIYKIVYIGTTLIVPAQDATMYCDKFHGTVTGGIEIVQNPPKPDPLPVEGDDD